MSKEIPDSLVKRMHRLQHELGALRDELPELRREHDAVTGRLNNLIDRVDRLGREWHDVLEEQSEWLADTQPDESK